MKFERDLYAQIYSFDGWVFAWFSNVQAPNLLGIQESMFTLPTAVHSLVEIYDSFIPLIIPLFSLSFPSWWSMKFNLFAKEELARVVGTKRRRDKKL